MDSLTSFSSLVLRNAKVFVYQDIPELWTLSLNAFRKSKLFPTSFADYLDYTQSDWIDVIPIFSSVFVIVSSIIIFMTLGFTEKEDSKPKYNKVRTYLIRCQALCYASGFLTSAIQHRTLWGEHGLMPVVKYNDRPKPIFSLIGFGDLQLEGLSWMGLYLCLLFVKFESMILAGALWASYLSIVNMKAAFTFNYGWEWLTCENGFLMIFLCSPPFIDRLKKKDTRDYKVSVIVLGLIRFLAFRLLLGAGMSKIGRNSSACWRELTCTTTHYETQPIPNPLSWYFHLKLPLWLHKLEVGMTFFEQLVLPYMMLVPHRWFRCFAAVMEIFFQFCIVGTGNYAWINYVGILPCIALFDDNFIEMMEQKVMQPVCNVLNLIVDQSMVVGTCMVSLFRGRVNQNDSSDFSSLSMDEQKEVEDIMTRELEKLLSKERENDNKKVTSSMFFNKIMVAARESVACIMEATHTFAIICLFVFMTYKAKDPIKELFGPAPWINAYDDYFFMTSQGVFGFINKMRIQVVMEYTHDKTSPLQWKELDFKCIPGSMGRKPCFLSPYHSRLDWETWIRVTASFEHVVDSKQYAPEQFGLVMQYNTPQFLGILSEKILQGDENAARLLGTPLETIYPLTNTSGSIPKKTIPTRIRFKYYLYEFADDKRSIFTIIKMAMQNIASKVTFGWINLVKTKVKPWWKRKEYKIPEEHYKLFKQPAKTSIQKFQKQFSYHNSSQFRHWMLGTSIVLIFVTLGCSTKNVAEAYSMLSKFQENNSLVNLFCLTASREDNVNNLKKDLANVAKRIRTLEYARLVRFLQHFVSYLIFGVALMIDYKDKTPVSEYLNYDLIKILAGGNVALSIIQFQQQWKNIVQSLWSKKSLIEEFIIVITNILIFRWADISSVETSIQYNLE